MSLSDVATYAVTSFALGMISGLFMGGLITVMRFFKH